jgi:hypothetical protein
MKISSVGKARIGWRSRWKLDLLLETWLCRNRNGAQSALGRPPSVVGDGRGDRRADSLRRDRCYSTLDQLDRARATQDAGRVARCVQCRRRA